MQPKKLDEHYIRERPLSYHARYLVRDVMWYADPSVVDEDLLDAYCS
jgi:hypothetical protein